MDFLHFFSMDQSVAIKVIKVSRKLGLITFPVPNEYTITQFALPLPWPIFICFMSKGLKII